MKIWCLRRNRKSIERREARFRALKDVWAHHDFRIFGREDIPLLKGYKPEVLMVFGYEASRLARDADLRAWFKVYFPSFWRGRIRTELPQLESGYYDLIIADESWWMKELGRAHPHVYHVDRGFDPAVFKPDWNAKKKWDISFIGNADGFGRRGRIRKLEKAFPGRVLNTKGESHESMARILQQSRIGWNQILSPRDRRGINYRVWEVLGSGALLLTSATDDVRMVLKDRAHAVFWRDDDEMVDLAGYYIRRWDDRGLRIARHGCELAHAKHTWAHRAQEIKNLIRRHYK